MSDCPSSKMPICGRAFGMENFLKILFPEGIELTFLAEKTRDRTIVNVEDEDEDEEW